MPFALRIALSLCMLWPLVSGTARSAAAEKSILVFGDSLSAAYGISRTRGWVALLAERLQRERSDYSVVNASVSGETSAGARARIGAALERNRPAVVIVALGGNDGLRGLPMAQMKDNLGDIVARSKKAGARVLLVGMKLPPNYGAEYTGAFEAAFRDLSARQRVPLVPFILEGFAEKPDYFQADQIHPTEQAQPLILERVWPALRPLLR